MALIAAEFIPVSSADAHCPEILPSPEGMAGQTVTAVGVLAVLTSLLLAPLTGNTDRRRILLAFFRHACRVLHADRHGSDLFDHAHRACDTRHLRGRLLVAGLRRHPAARPHEGRPRALSIVYAGVSVATIIALPVASWIGHLIGWRNVFFPRRAHGRFRVRLAIPRPALPPGPRGQRFPGHVRPARRTWILAGIGGNILSFGGYHIFFTYLRPLSGAGSRLGSQYAFRDPAGLRSGERPRHLHCGRAPRESLPVNHDSGPSGLHSRRARLCSPQGHADIGIALAVFWGIRVRLYPGRLVHMDRPHPLRQGGACRRELTVAATQFAIGLAAAVGGVHLMTTSASMASFWRRRRISVMAALLIAVSFSLFARTRGTRPEPISVAAIRTSSGSRG